MQSAQFHQLKKDILRTRSAAACVSSNWSAPKLSSAGLCPPVPTETR